MTRSTFASINEPEILQNIPDRVCGPATIVDHIAFNTGGLLAVVRGDVGCSLNTVRRRYSQAAVFGIWRFGFVCRSNRPRLEARARVRSENGEEIGKFSDSADGRSAGG